MRSRDNFLIYMEEDTNKKDDIQLDETDTETEKGEDATSRPDDQPEKETVRVVEQNLDYKDAHARAVADYDNLKKETARLRQEYARYAACEVVEQMLPVLDNLNKALDQAPEDNTQWVDGIKLIREQFQRVMEAAGVQPLGAEGEPFDPNRHEALMREKRDGVESDIVVQVIEPGYKMHDKTLRPAKVIVAE
jgi:molecular chaperone GrpE